MASAVIRPTSGQPGPVATTANLALYNEFNFVINDYIPDLFDRYGAEQYGMIMKYLGKTASEAKTDTNAFEHFEKGRAFASGIVNATVANATAGLSVTITLKAGSYFFSGTKTAFREGEIGYIGSTGVKFQVGTITPTTNAFTVVLKPTGSADALASLGGAGSILINEQLFLVGNQAAGESSTVMSSSEPYVYKITNTATQVRDDFTITDLAKMEKTQIDFGGGSYYYYKLAQTELNKRFMYYEENACMEGVDVSNLGTGQTGTTGTIPAVSGTCPEVDYVTGAMVLSDLQALSRVCDFNGGTNEYHMLQETNQVDDTDEILFGLYNNGAIRYASVGGDVDLGVKYGFKSFNIKARTFHFYNYKNFSPETVYGASPTITYFRKNYGLGVPQGVKADAKTGSTYPPMQWVYQYVTPGVKYHTYTSGGLSPENKTTTMNFVLTQICYVGSRTIAAPQFCEFLGT